MKTAEIRLPSVQKEVVLSYLDMCIDLDSAIVQAIFSRPELSWDSVGRNYPHIDIAAALARSEESRIERAYGL